MSRAGIQIHLTEEQLQKAGEYAYNGCQNNTIEGLMDWSDDFINKRPELSKFLTKKRQERKKDLRKAQTDTAITAKNAVMQIFLGKNELGQSDKNEANQLTDNALSELIKQIKPSKGVLPANEADT